MKRHDREQASTQTFFAVNPATGEPLEPMYAEATSDEIDQAVREAEAAFVLYRKKSGTEKAAFLEGIAAEIMALGDALIHRCMAETGLPEGRLRGERGRTVNQLKLFADLLREGSWVDARIDTALPDRQPVPRPDIRQIHIPLGPVGIFGAGNFPLAFSVAGGDTASALAAGCSVVVKAHPAHPGTSGLVGSAITKAARETGMPPGVFSLVQGASVAVGMAVVRHPLIKAIGFTGSFRGGKAIFDAAVRRPEPIPVYAEMGSVNPIFLLPGALATRGETIAQGLAQSVALGGGQFCTNPGVVVSLASEAADRFLEHTGRHLATLAPGTMLTESIRAAYDAGIARMTAIEGVDVVARGSSDDGFCTGTAYLLKTTTALFLNHPHLAEEVFGPSTIVVTARDKEDLLALAANLAGHLTATVHGTAQDLKTHADLLDMLERKVGRLIVNGFPTGVEVCPAMNHGGPFPATTATGTTSVGTAAIRRFARPLCYQDVPPAQLPDALKDENPLGIWRLVNGQFTRDAL